MGQPIKSYKDLIAWQKGMVLVKLVYRWSQGMPSEEKFGLTNQMRRAAVSIPSNIAEGYGRGTRADYVRSLRIARGSLYELDTQVRAASMLEMLTENAELRASLDEEDRVLQGLINSLEKPE